MHQNTAALGFRDIRRLVLGLLQLGGTSQDKILVNWLVYRRVAEEKKGSAKQLCRRIRQGKAGGKSHEDHHGQEGRLDADRHRFINIQ